MFNYYRDYSEALDNCHEYTADSIGVHGKTFMRLMLDYFSISVLASKNITHNDIFAIYSCKSLKHTGIVHDHQGSGISKMAGVITIEPIEKTIITYTNMEKAKGRGSKMSVLFVKQEHIYEMLENMENDY